MYYHAMVIFCFILFVAVDIALCFFTLCLAGFSVCLIFCCQSTILVIADACFSFVLIPYIFSKHNMFVSISSVICSYLSCTALVTQTPKAHTVNNIENMMISVKFKLQTNGN